MCPYGKVVIFVDNAGIDFVLGILPFARELLKLGTKVILVGNTLPALNDVTFRELKSYINEASHQCNIFMKALNENRLQCYENGQRGPCLDLSSLPEGELPLNIPVIIRLLLLLNTKIYLVL